MLWVIFAFFIFIALFLDLGIFRKENRVFKGREASIWSMVWIILALIFGGFIYVFKGQEALVQYYTGFVIEKGLSIDNIFVFFVIFSYLKIDPKYQHRILFLGVLGAFFIRLIFIYFGVYLVHHVDWIMYLFGALLLFFAIQLLRKGKTYDPKKSVITKVVSKIVPIDHSYKGDAFLVKNKGKIFGTPLFLALVLVEVVDIIAAMDSIPAIFAVTTDPLIVYTSNIFAVLGLRALYFVVVHFLKQFRYLEVGLASMLFFLAFKTLIGDFYKIPSLVSLSIVLGILAIAVICSLRIKKRS